MRANLIIARTILAASLGLIAGISSLSVQAAEQSPGVPTTAPSAGEPAVVASGAVEDSFSACLARIPKDASAGQRMMAEQSCKRDEGAREIVRDAPHR